MIVQEVVRQFKEMLETSAFEELDAVVEFYLRQLAPMLRANPGRPLQDHVILQAVGAAVGSMDFVDETGVEMQITVAPSEDIAHGVVRGKGIVGAIAVVPGSPGMIGLAIILKGTEPFKFARFTIAAAPCQGGKTWH